MCVHQPDRQGSAVGLGLPRLVGDDVVAGEEWRRYRFIRDAGRDPDELWLSPIFWLVLILVA
jgi:hypothetical protein